MRTPPVPRFVQTEDRALIRDTHSKALLNTDLGALERHRTQLRKLQATNELSHKVNALDQTCKKLEDSINAVTDMQREILLLLQQR